MSYDSGQPPITGGDEKGGWVRANIVYIGHNLEERLTFIWNEHYLRLTDSVVNGFFMAHNVNEHPERKYFATLQYSHSNGDKSETNRQIRVEFDENDLSMVVKADEKYVVEGLTILQEALQRTRVPKNNGFLLTNWYLEGVNSVLQAIDLNGTEFHAMGKQEYGFVRVLQPIEGYTPIPKNAQRAGQESVIALHAKG